MSTSRTPAPRNTAAAAASRQGKNSPLRRFINGEADFPVIQRSRTWALIALVLLLICVAGLLVRGLNFSIEFTGGTAFVVENAPAEFTSGELRDALGDELGLTDVTAQVVDDGDGALVSTPELGEVGGERERAAVDAIAEVTGSDRGDIARDSVGPTWGAAVTEQALMALGVFIGLVVIYISLRFELRMAVAALTTLLHDIVVTIGIYAIVGFEVSPASVIALLTILGYSLYDTVVVFDRVKEDTRGLTATSNRTYGEVANDALNGVMVRSLSTSISSLLPTGALLFIGAQLLGADTLQDLALALFIGMGVGTYSSIFIATPMLVWLKERFGEEGEHKERLEAARGGAGA